MLKKSIFSHYEDPIRAMEIANHYILDFIEKRINFFHSIIGQYQNVDELKARLNSERDPYLSIREKPY
mgnify:CR=1 FL=1